MPIYNYDNTSLIDKVKVIKNASGGVRAYLQARAEATPSQLKDAITQLHNAGYMAVPTEIDGAPVLEVRGFGKETKLQSTLVSLNLVNSSGTKEEISEDNIPLGKRLKKRTLLASMITYLVGDIAYTIYGKMQEDKEKARATDGEAASRPEDKYAGLFYGLGTWVGIAAMIMRGDQSESEINKASEAAIAAAQAAGVMLDENDAIVRAAAGYSNKNAVVKKISKYPSELMNLCFSVAGFFVAKGARKDLRNLKKAEEANPALKSEKAHTEEIKISKQDIFLGSTTFASGLIGGLVPEKKPNPDAPKPTGIRAVGSWISQRPLAIAASGLLVSTAVHLKSSLEQMRASRMKGESLKPSYYRLTFVITNLAAELLMAFSSKGHGKGVKSDETIDPSTCALVAEMIHKRAPEKREELITKMAAALSQPHALHSPQDMLEQTIRQQLAALDKNPWAVAGKTNVAATTQHQNEPELKVGKTSPAEEKKWAKTISMVPAEENAELARA